jgi:hypothetical protein
MTTMTASTARSYPSLRAIRRSVDRAIATVAVSLVGVLGAIVAVTLQG